MIERHSDSDHGGGDDDGLAELVALGLEAPGST
jgi:hypothetical protein